MPDCRRADAGHGHEGVGARLPDAPNAVLAQVEKLGKLKKITFSSYSRKLCRVVKSQQKSIYRGGRGGGNLYNNLHY